MSTAESGAGTIRLRREGGHLRDHLYRYKVVLDGNRIGRIASGQERDFVVGVGQHRLHLASSPSFFRSPKRVVTINENATLALRCRPGGSFLAGLLSFLKPHKYIALEIEPG